MSTIKIKKSDIPNQKLNLDLDLDPTPEVDIINKKFKSVVESTDDSDNTKKFKRMLNIYLTNLTKFSENTNPEFEIRFGTKKIKPITKIDFYNVVKSLLTKGFKLNNENYSLKIISDNELSNIRTQINGLPNIQHYCKFNSVTGVLDKSNIEFIDKNKFIHQDVKLYPIDMDEFNFRIAYQVEKTHGIMDASVQDIINKFNTTKKLFRYIKRFEYIHPELPFLIHCSIVKTSKSNITGKFIPQFNIKDSEVFTNIEHYEIEIELNNTLIGLNTKYETGVYLYNELKDVIKYVLIGLQQSNYPIKISEENHNSYP